MNDSTDEEIPEPELPPESPGTFRFDYVKDDPCYGCKYAVSKPQDILEREGGFARRLLCTNLCRLTAKKMRLMEFVSLDKFQEAQKTLNEIADLTQYSKTTFKCSDKPFRDWCYNSTDAVKEEES